MKKITGLLLSIGLLGCTTFYAKRDYEQYPNYKKEIALYNITHLLEHNCQRPQADSYKFSCVRSECLESQQQTTANPSMGPSGSLGYSTTTICTKSSPPHDVGMTWASLRQKNITREGNCIHYSGGTECDIQTKDERQAADLIEAFKIYLE